MPLPPDSHEFSKFKTGSTQLEDGLMFTPCLFCLFHNEKHFRALMERRKRFFAVMDDTESSPPPIPQGGSGKDPSRSDRWLRL
mmetsp:Transcript_20124/g.38159  ORF Transcript_20124/g.38159 Transcript_20124/m.38159 type:complete len:83 (-) Transcript_20124:88-336(-)